MYFSEAASRPRLLPGALPDSVNHTAVAKYIDSRGMVHRLVSSAPRRCLRCAHCKAENNKFPSGSYTRKSYYKCSICEVPLCRTEVLDCFFKFHSIVDKLLKQWSNFHFENNFFFFIFWKKFVYCRLVFNFLCG